MSDLNIEKDDQATQEMLEMMGELSDEMDSTLQSDSPTEDDLLKELEGLPDALKEEPPIEKTDEFSEPEEASLAVEDIDALMSELDESSETSIEIPTTAEATNELVDAIDEPSENTASKDTDEHMDSLENTINSAEEEMIDSPLLDEESVSKEETTQEETSNVVEELEDSTIQEMVEDTDNIATSTDKIADPQPSEEVVHSEVTDSIEDKNTPNEASPLISQTQQAVETMNEAIQIEQEVQEIASSVQNNAQEAVQIAISTSKQAQQSAEQVQQAIEATFTASEQAFEAAKKAGYQINTNELNAQQPSDEIVKQLQQIEDKNQTLKEVNQNLKQRISELTQD